MKKVFVLVSCFAVVFILSTVSFAQSEEAEAPAPEESQLSVEDIVGEAHSQDARVWLPAYYQVLPFGYPPYPSSVSGHPAYGIPYSYPKAPRRLGNRFAPPSYQPHPLPVPGVVAGALPPPAPPMVAPPMVMGQMPQHQGTLAVQAPAYATPQGQPMVVYRPTPVKNFVTLMSSPRPYIGYNPYAGYPPYPGYIPPQ